MRRKKEQPVVNTDLQKYIYLEKQTCSGQTLHDVLKESNVDDFILKYRVDTACEEYEVFALRDRSSFDIKKQLLDLINPKEEKTFSCDSNLQEGEDEITVRFYWRPLTSESLLKKVYPVELTAKEQKKAIKEAKKQLKKLKKSKKQLKLEEKTSALEEQSEI